jgi:hypothetical protein
MLKLVGILTGSALAVAFLIVTLGVPDFSAPEQPVAAEIVEEQIAGSGSVTELVLAEPDDTELVPASLETDPDPEPSSETDPELAETQEALAEIDASRETEALIEQIFNPGPEVVVEENWYAFWSPFRSEIAANGFVAKLQETTGIDYRVVKVKTGVYEVAFAYLDDADIQDKLARISNATGMNMTDS